jgi:hypothetical protein
MLNGVGGPGGPPSGPPSNKAPDPPVNPDDPWNLRRLIQQGGHGAEREASWVKEQTDILDKLDKMTDVERAHHWSLMSGQGKPEEAARQEKLFRELHDKSPEERKAALGKQFQDMEVNAITGIFKAQFTSLIMKNIKNVEEAVKR